MHTVFALGLALLLSAFTASAQNYPSKPIRIVTAAAGGNADFVVRVVANALTSNLGQQVLVDNRGGAGGVIAGSTVSKAAPDGHTVLIYGSAIWLVPFMRKDVPYDPAVDFSPVTLATSSPNILVVHPSVPVKSVQELIALARAKPGQIANAGGNTGSSAHLASELFIAMAHVNILRVPYKGVGPSLNALVAGEVDMMFPPAGAVDPHVKQGRLRALAATSAKPTRLAPGLPTVAASGVPGYESEAVLGVFVPAKTSADIVTRLNQVIRQVLSDPVVKDRLFDSGVDTVGSSPAELAAFVKADMVRSGKLIKDIGIRGD